MLREHPELSGQVLEIGAGSGAMAAALLTRFPGVKLTAIDLDPVMVDDANQRLARFGDRADARVADATALPFDDGSFDAVCTWLMLHHTIEWERCLAEAVRVLRPSGLLFGYDLTDTRVARMIHHLDGSPHRLATAKELATALAALPITGVHARPALLGHVVRFAGYAQPRRS